MEADWFHIDLVTDIGDLQDFETANKKH